MFSRPGGCGGGHPRRGPGEFFMREGVVILGDIFLKLLLLLQYEVKRIYLVVGKWITKNSHFADRFAKLNARYQLNIN